MSVNWPFVTAMLVAIPLFLFILWYSKRWAEKTTTKILKCYHEHPPCDECTPAMSGSCLTKEACQKSVRGEL